VNELRERPARHADDLVEIVEQELGSKVVAFMSQNHIDPDVAGEVFVLEPADVVWCGNPAPELVTPPNARVEVLTSEAAISPRR
jgi:hypothetical protein